MYDISIDRLGTKYGNVYEMVIACAVRARDIYNRDEQDQVVEEDEPVMEKTATKALREMVSALDNSEN